MKLNKTTIQILVAIAIAAAAYASGRYLQPAKVVTKIQMKEVQIVKRNEVVRIVDRKLPDGTVERIEDRETKESSENKKDSSSEKLVISQKSSSLSLLLISNSSLDEQKYAIHATHNFIGPFSAGGYVDNKKQFGISIGMSF